MKIIDKDKGWKKIAAAVKAEHAKVGVQDDGDPRRDDRDVSNLDLAMIHEFGTATVPERSFIRSSFDEHVQEYSQLLETGSRLILGGKRSVHQIVGALGEKCLSDIKNKIDSSVPPPDLPETIARKGSSTTLIDTAQMKNSLTVEFEDG